MLDWENIEIIAEDENIVRLTSWNDVEIISEEDQYLVKTADSDIINVDACDRMIIFSGQQGKQGEPGEQGPAGSVRVGRTTTLPAGSQATVTNRGTTQSAILDFGIPKGADGQSVGIWGEISGDISDQTDLVTALAEKANSADLGALADHDTVDYLTEVTNKPALGDMAFEDDAPADSKEYVRKNHGWSEKTGVSSVAWGDITGTLANQSDLAAAINAKANTADLGSLASKDTVDYSTEVTNKPTLGNLANHDTVDYVTEVTGKPTLGALAGKNTVDWDTDIDDIPSVFPPGVHTHDDRYYTESETDTLLSAKADTANLGDLATKDTVDYDTDIDNLPTLGGLASKNTVDWDTDIDDIPSTFPPSSHNHAAGDITSGTLSTARGGTGNANGTIAKLTTARSLYVNLGSTYDSSNPVTFDGSANKALPVTGTLGTARGGTGGALTTETWTNSPYVDDSSTEINCTKMGKICVITGHLKLKTTLTSAYINFGNLSSAYKPKEYVYSAVGGQDGIGFLQIYSENGAMRFYKGQNSQWSNAWNIYINVTYFVA